MPRAYEGEREQNKGWMESSNGRAKRRSANRSTESQQGSDK